jgi:hypothetical protein
MPDDVLFQVTFVIPASKLGGLLATLPPKLNPQIARLVDSRPGPTTGKTWKRQQSADGSYTPAKGTTGDALLKLLKRSSAMYRRDMVDKMPNEKRPAIMSALDRLLKFKMVQKNEDGTYEAV